MTFSSRTNKQAYTQERLFHVKCRYLCVNMCIKLSYLTKVALFKIIIIIIFVSSHKIKQNIVRRYIALNFFVGKVREKKYIH